MGAKIGLLGLRNDRLVGVGHDNRLAMLRFPRRLAAPKIAALVLKAAQRLPG